MTLGTLIAPWFEGYDVEGSLRSRAVVQSRGDLILQKQAW